MNILTTEDLRPAALGKHLIADFYGASQLFDCAPVSAVLEEAALAAGATVLNVDMRDFGDRCGFTGVALLAESHISIHTWPECDYAAIDIFMCGDADPSKSLDVLRRYFSPDNEQVQMIQRGVMASASARA